MLPIPLEVQSSTRSIYVFVCVNFGAYLIYRGEATDSSYELVHVYPRVARAARPSMPSHTNCLT